MAGTFVCNLVHFVWSTKHRQPLIDTKWQDRLFGYLGGILRNNGAVLIQAGGMPDHVHLLASLPSTLSLAKAVNLLKSNSTTWVHDEIQGRSDFRWQEGYGAFSVSRSAQRRVVEYIHNQQKHHQTTNFKQEFVALLKRHEIEFDETYVWD